MTVQVFISYWMAHSPYRPGLLHRGAGTGVGEAGLEIVIDTAILGRGSAVEVSDLAPGNHDIQLAAGTGQRAGTASVSVAVGDLKGSTASEAG
jgi:hypothetical protein